VAGGAECRGRVSNATAHLSKKSIVGSALSNEFGEDRHDYRPSDECSHLFIRAPIERGDFPRFSEQKIGERVFEDDL
jgi:hypothetical protein